MILSGLAVNWPIALVWAIFWVYWMLSILYEVVTKRYKKTEKTSNFGVETIERFSLWIAVLLVLTNVAQLFYPLSVMLIQQSTLSLYSGFLTSLLGVSFAIWARVYLGGNWSGWPALKKGQTLTRTGPYAIVRHPIYAGMSLGVIGGAIYVGNVGGLLAMALILVFSHYRITVEEKFMKQKFGKEYIEYSKRVKAFVPGFL
jgi:protein-S-isoprenylcysteine O-methyltransferase Ste14